MTTLKAQRAAEVLANRKIAFASKVANLTGHVAGRLPASEMIRAFNDGKTADDFAAEIASREPVGLVLHPVKVDAVNAAGDAARGTIQKVREILEAAGWDIDAVAPYPTGRESREVYKRMSNRRSMFSTMTKAVDPYTRRAEPKTVVMSDEGMARFISNAEQMAAAQYDSFICKMVAKSGPDVVDATLDGNHVWTHSILIVTLRDGTVQRWKTQQITNTSVHGLSFPQWPSRIVK